MSADKKKIGLVLASIHTGAARNVWPSFARIAGSENKTLFIFPGGRLNARSDSENLRNPVYSLVNSGNLDGFIIWSSTIRYTESKEEFEHFHSGFEPLPYVTLSYKIPGHPCVEFDAYTGMKNLIAHCIRFHGARNIAFLRGPAFHSSALARLKGYEDALGEAGLPLVPESELVTTPFNWDNGAAAAAQLFENRKLRPGKDFDTLVGSSDLMTLGAITYLSKQGYHVPGDYHALGFNNSMESRLTESPLSTVHLPYAALSSESFRILAKLLGKRKNTQSKKNPIEDVFLPTEPILRESCGCGDSHLLTSCREGEGGNEGIKLPPAGKEQEEALKSLIVTHLKLGNENIESLVTPVLRALPGISPQGNPGTVPSFPKDFFNLFEKALILFFDSHQDAELLFTLIETISRSGLVPASLMRRIEPVLYRKIYKVREQIAIHSQYEWGTWNTALNSLKCELLGTRDRNSLVQSLARHLPKIGINTAGIALYGDEKTSLWVGSFSPEGISPVREQSFSARLLVPESLESEFSRGIFMVQPLFIENQSLGYFVHTVPIHDGVIFEELRSAVSNAFKGIFQLEEMVRAIRIAEQAERAKTEFLQSLENELYDPLAGVMERIDALEKLGSTDPAFALELKSFRDFVASREEQAGGLIDLAFSRIEEQELNKTLFDPEELLPGIGSVKTPSSFPLLFGDTSGLSQCFDIIREEYSGPCSAVIAYEGLTVSFRTESARKRKRGEGGREQGLLLSERIILMHGGDFKRNNSACIVTLPWPTLAGGSETSRRRGRQDNILVLSGQPVPAALADLAVVRDPEKAAALPGGIAFIIWNSTGAGPEDLLKIASLRHRNEFTAAAFLCFGKEFAGKQSIIEGAEKLIRSPKKGTLLFIGGDRENRLTFRELNADEITIASMSLFSETVEKISPDIIIFDSLNTEGAAMVRRHSITVTVPIIMVSDRINSAADITALNQHSRLILCHSSVASSVEFCSRLQALLGGDEILPPHTGALVKKTLLYFDENAGSHISRWKLADAVNVSEDYLSRIFHREMGLSLWDYLNRLRVYMAVEMLLRTDESIQEIASRSGFQDHAYFCRVFKKIYGVPPGQLRKQQEKAE